MTDPDRRGDSNLARGMYERRETASVGLECRTSDDGVIRMGGWASVTGVPYTVGSFEEVVRPGAFKRTLNEKYDGRGPKVSLLVNHAGLLLASTPSSTLQLSEDDRGLRWDAELDGSDPESASLARKVKRGLVTDCSFAFLVTDDDWNADRTKRTIQSVSLHRGDVSVVTEGANPHASVAVRAIELAEQEGRARQMREEIARLDQRDRDRERRLLELGIVRSRDRPRVDVRSAEELLMGTSREARLERLVAAERQRIDRLRRAA